jgi:hypothetical protein
MFIEFVNGGVGRADFNDLRTNLRNKAAVAGSAGGRLLRLQPSLFQNSAANRFDQDARRG